MKVGRDCSNNLLKAVSTARASYIDLGSDLIKSLITVRSVAKNRKYNYFYHQITLHGMSHCFKIISLFVLSI